MCLEVNLRFHQGQTVPEPFVAPYDILVWKLLKRKIINGCFYTPWQNKIVYQWYNGCAILESQLGPEGYVTHNTDCLEAYVNEGIHAFFRFGDFLYRTLNKKEVFGNDYQLDAYPSVIPKGAKFFIGRYDEIVSNELHVYLSNSYVPNIENIDTLEHFIRDLEHEKNRT